jgi:hypothetical protein
MHLAWTDGSSHAHWPWKSPARLALRALTRGCSPSTLTSCIHLPVPLCSTPVTALLSSYGDSDSSASLLPDRGLPASRHTSFETILHPTTQGPPIITFTRYPSARWVSPHGVQTSPVASRLAGTSGRIDFVSCGLVSHLRLLSTSLWATQLPSVTGRRAYA